MDARKRGFKIETETLITAHNNLCLSTRSSTGHQVSEDTPVEFALHPQHEASCDSEIQTVKDFKNKFRKQLESSPTTSVNSEGKEETLECLKS